MTRSNSFFLLNFQKKVKNFDFLKVAPSFHDVQTLKVGSSLKKPSCDVLDFIFLSIKSQNLHDFSANFFITAFLMSTQLPCFPFSSFPTLFFSRYSISAKIALNGKREGNIKKWS